MLELHLRDEEWPFEYTDHDRMIVRAIVFDDDDFFYFVRAVRDDIFGKAEMIETAGGGVEKGEDPETALTRELKEELGADADIIVRLGVVDDYYNILHRHNINNYYLCKVRSFGERKLTPAEINDFHLSVLKLSCKDAEAEYLRHMDTKIGRLIAKRELPVLREAKKYLEEYHYAENK